MKVLMVDNYDSFTYNLVHLLEGLGAQVRVLRNDVLDPRRDLSGVHALVVSPGPCTPDKAGESVEAIRQAMGEMPVLGVCLGHQCLAAALGGRVVRARRLLHGKVSSIYHDGAGIFRGIPSPFTSCRYHSLVVEEASLPPELLVTARDDAGEVMAVAHSSLPVYGVQFHPEAYLTRHGETMVANFLDTVR
jgi:anthranilate synthase/aminodeoxychorismate synthase-like glutamine amidotransferase